MSISRGFLVMGALYLLIGIAMGIYMGGTDDHTLTPVHAHINLLGFTLMTIFGVLYRVIPEMADNMMATIHFWGHQLGGVVLLAALYLMISGTVGEATLVPFLIISELVVLVSIAAYAWNVISNVN